LYPQRSSDTTIACITQGAVVWSSALGQLRSRGSRRVPSMCRSNQRTPPRIAAGPFWLVHLRCDHAHQISMLFRQWEKHYKMGHGSHGSPFGEALRPKWPWGMPTKAQSCCRGCAFVRERFALKPSRGPTNGNAALSHKLLLSRQMQRQRSDDRDCCYKK
jgi:hypothetical protein